MNTEQLLRRPMRSTPSRASWGSTRRPRRRGRRPCFRRSCRASRAGGGGRQPAIGGGLGGLFGTIGGLGGGGLLDNVVSRQPTETDKGNQILGQIFGSKDGSRAVAADAAASPGSSRRC